MNELPGLSADRLKKAIFAFVRELFPQADFFGFYLYSVAAWNDGEQIGDLTPSASTAGLPAIRCPVRLPGLKVNLRVGQEVLVGFDNHDPTRPFIAHLGTLGTGLFPLSTTLEAGAIKIGDGATLGAARNTDPVSVGTLSFVPGSGGAQLLYNGTPVTSAVQITGTITGGSAKVRVE